jgi:hypothetical protein
MVGSRQDYNLFASSSAMIAVAAAKIRLPSYENLKRGSSGVKLWKAKNRAR